MTDDDITTIVGWPTEPEMVKFRKVAAAAEAAVASQSTELAALRADTERLRGLVESSFREAYDMAYSRGVSAGHPLGRDRSNVDRDWLESDAAMAAHKEQSNG